MSIDKLIVIFTGIPLIGFVYWFFFWKKEDVGLTDKTLNIVVDGGYKPSIIKILKNQKTSISILRKDKNSCLEEIVFPDFRIKKYLPLGEKVEIDITPKEKGEFSFHCGMNMFSGKVIVV